MRFLSELAAALAALVAGITVGHVTASLNAPTPWPQLAAITVGLAAIYALDGWISILLTHRAARRS